MTKKLDKMRERGKEVNDVLLSKLLSKFYEFKNDKKGADLIEWVGLIALVIGVVMLVSPQARSSIQNLFTTVFNNLKNMSTGG